MVRCIKSVMFLLFILGSHNSVVASVCVDEYGRDIECPDFSEGVIISDDYRMLEPPPTSLAKTTATSSISYSSGYSSQDYRVTEEFVDNYNEIGDKVGTHKVMYQMKRRVVDVTWSYPVQKCKTLINIDFTFGNIEGPYIPIKTCSWVTENVTYQELRGFYFTLAERKNIADVNIYNAEDAMESFAHLGHLSDIPQMKRIINVHDYGAPYDNSHCRASAYAFMGKGDNDPWNKVLIVSDGFDPRSRIAIQEIMEGVENTLAPGGSAFVKTLLENGYDVVFVDPGPVGEDIVDNARSLLRVIEYVCEKSTGKVRVGGYSMGGLLARVALLLGEKNNLTCMQKVFKFLSIDSPHLGAQINYDFQQKLFSIKDGGLTNPTDIAAYEAVAACVYDLERIHARQLLFKHARGSLNEDFYAFIKSMGDYPKRIELNAIGDAAWKWPYPDLSISSGTKAAVFNGKDIFIKEDDLFPGSYIDLWASSTAWSADIPLAIFGIPFGSIPISSDLHDDWIGLFPEEVNTTENFPSDGSRYKPTFIPLYSAFGISKEDFQNIPLPQNQSDLNSICSKYSPFDRIMLVNFEDRPVHIVYNDDLADKVLRIARNTDMTAILQLLLD